MNCLCSSRCPFLGRGKTSFSLWCPRIFVANQPWSRRIHFRRHAFEIISLLCSLAGSLVPKHRHINCPSCHLRRVPSVAPRFRSCQSRDRCCSSPGLVASNPLKASFCCQCFRTSRNRARHICKIALFHHILIYFIFQPVTDFV